MNKFSNKWVIGTVTVVTITTSVGVAYAADVQQKISGRQWRQAAHQALESGNYDDWLSAQQQAFERRTSKERFEKLQAFHQLLADGKHDEAKKFAQGNNLGLGGHRRSMKHRMR